MTTIDRYELVEQIGTRGNVAIWLAKDTLHGGAETTLGHDVERDGAPPESISRDEGPSSATYARARRLASSSRAR